MPKHVGQKVKINTKKYIVDLLVNSTNKQTEDAEEEGFGGKEEVATCMSSVSTLNPGRRMEETGSFRPMESVYSRYWGLSLCTVGTGGSLCVQ
jgi:hypothetical protein